MQSAFLQIALYFLRAFQILVILCIAGLSFLSPGAEGDTGAKAVFLTDVYGQRFAIAIVLALTLELLNILRNYLSRPSNLTKEIRQTIMDAMMGELFRNDTWNFRISIFKDASFLRNRWMYLKRFFSSKTAWKEISQKYVYVWDRLGRPNSKTCLRFHASKEKRCEGVAGQCRHTGLDLLVEDLPDLSKIDLLAIDILGRTHQAKVVRHYLDDGYVNMQTLKSLNRKARHLYGNVLTDEKGNIKGVLVIDNFEQVSPFDDEVLKKIPYYLKIIASTL